MAVNQIFYDPAKPVLTSSYTDESDKSGSGAGKERGAESRFFSQDEIARILTKRMEEIEELGRHWLASTDFASKCSIDKVENVVSRRRCIPLTQGIRNGMCCGN